MWEYSILALGETIENMQNQLKDLGEKGWELVFILEHPDQPQFTPTLKVKSKLFAFFKREIKPKT